MILADEIASTMDPKAAQPVRAPQQPRGERRTVAIHQPNYFPNLAFFRKLAQSDVFIVLDDVQYRRRGYINRNRIKTPQGVLWLSIPVLSKGKYHSPICEMTPNWNDNWRQKHLRTIVHSYKRSAFFDEVFAHVIEPTLGSGFAHRPALVDANVTIIRAICAYLDLRTPMRHSSEFGIKERAGLRLACLVQCVGGTNYLSGVSGRKYIDPVAFDRAQIELSYVSNEKAQYPQLWGAFQPGLSILDLLFNCGRKSIQFLFDTRADHATSTRVSCPAC